MGQLCSSRVSGRKRDGRVVLLWIVAAPDVNSIHFSIPFPFSFPPLSDFSGPAGTSVVLSIGKRTEFDKITPRAPWATAIHSLRKSRF